MSTENTRERVEGENETCKTSGQIIKSQVRRQTYTLTLTLNVEV